MIISSEKIIDSAILASSDIPIDINRLLRISLSFHKLKKESNWQNVLPNYPNSPVSNMK